MLCNGAGFVWPDSGRTGVTGVASVGSCQNLPTCPAETMPPGSKTD